MKVELEPNRMTLYSPKGFHYWVFVVWLSIMCGWGGGNEEEELHSVIKYSWGNIMSALHGNVLSRKKHYCFIVGATSQPPLFSLLLYIIISKVAAILMYCKHYDMSCLLLCLVYLTLTVHIIDVSITITSLRICLLARKANFHLLWENCLFVAILPCV